MGWEDVVESDILKLRNSSPLEIEQELTVLLDTKSEFDLKQGAINDCFFNIVIFAQEHNLNDSELLFLLKLQKELLLKCKNGCETAENCTEVLKREFVEHSDAFQICNGRKLINFMLQSFVHHYYLYCYILTNEQSTEDVSKEVTIEVIPAADLLPMEYSVDEESYHLSITEGLKQDSMDAIIPGETPSPETFSPHEDEDECEKEEEITSKEISPSFILSTLPRDQMKNVVVESALRILGKAKDELERRITDNEAWLIKSLKLNP